MNKHTVLVTARSFAKSDPAPLLLLQDAGCEVIRLPEGGAEPALWLEQHLPCADAVIAGLEPYSRQLIEKCKNLKIISRYGVGYDAVNMEAAREKNILVAITPGANSDSVADLAVSLMLAAARHVPHMDASIKSGGKDRPLGVEMWRKTLGVIGTGRIGKGVIRRACGFEMQMLCYDAYKDEDFVSAHNGRYVDLDTLLQNSDFITIHAPLTEETRNMIGDEALLKMKKRAVIVNTARGGIIDEEALYRALKDGEIGAAALDATVVEPACDSPLCSLPNCILTPHAGATTYESVLNMGMMAAQNVIDVLTAGTCANLV